MDIHADVKNAVIDSLRASAELRQAVIEQCTDSIAAAGEAIHGSLRQGGKLLLFGNGGSAADAQHVAAEFVGRFIKDRDPLAAIALTTDTSALTAIGNDYGYERVFSRQVEALGKPHDVALAISTSGRSLVTAAIRLIAIEGTRIFARASSCWLRSALAVRDVTMGFWLLQRQLEAVHPICVIVRQNRGLDCSNLFRESSSRGFEQVALCNCKRDICNFSKTRKS